jgi:hypothetical protein
MQILLDIQDILTPDHVHDPFHELHERLDREVAMKEMLEKSWSTPFNHQGEASRMRHAMTHDLEFHKAVASDSCDTLKPNPIRCGLLVYDAYLELRSSGLRFERSTGQTCMMAHLYVATRLLAPDSPKWPDMDFLIAQQDVTRLFFGGLPKTFEECVRKVYLMMGRSQAEIARAYRAKKKGNKSDKTMFVRNKDGRWMEETSILTPIFKPRSYGWSTTNASVDD